MSGGTKKKAAAKTTSARRTSRRTAKQSTKTIFVSMPFGPEWSLPVFERLKAAAKKAGHQAIRVDHQTYVGNIALKITEQIREAALVIADLTGANPSVMLEVGKAMECGKPIVYACQGSPSELPVWVRNENIIVYEPSKKGLATLEHKVFSAVAGILGAGCKRIAVVSRKGGVGKTTSVLNLGWSFAQSGKHVLLVDMDPAACLTNLVCEKEPIDSKSIGALLAKQGALVPAETSHPRVHIIPGKWAQTEVTLPMVGGLRSALDAIPVAGKYDVVLVDTGAMSVVDSWKRNALAAVDFALVPTDLSPPDLSNLSHYIAELRAQQEELQFHVLGVFANRVTQAHAATQDEIRERVRTLARTARVQVIGATVRDAADVAAAALRHEGVAMPVKSTASARRATTPKVAKDYTALIGDIEKLMGS